MRNERIKALHDRVGSVIRGKDEAIKLAIVTLLGGGHLLIEDIPGVGKTTLAFTLANAISASFQRIQFTSDLLPSDITGVSVYDQRTGEFEFRPGPVFANIVLADEINRTSPKTQSALLEAMNERRVTVDGKTHILKEPFMVIATQNPMEYHGTFPLPESQLDRFMLHMRLGYPALEHEKAAVRDIRGFDEIERMEPVIGAEDLVAMQAEVKQVTVDESLVGYILDIVRLTRTDGQIRLGASTRGGQFLLRAASAHAYYEGRDYVTPGDVKVTAPHVLGHRLILKSRTYITDADRIVRGLLEKVPVPI